MIGKNLSRMLKSGDYAVQEVRVPEQEVWVRVHNAIFRYRMVDNGKLIFCGQHNAWTLATSHVSMPKAIMREIREHVLAIAMDRFHNKK